MADNHIPDTRRRNMAAIRGANTRPELLVRRALHARGFRYRLHVSSLPGKPDIVLPKYNAAILINGCFWHGHCCPAFRWPKTRQDFWRDKIGRNKDRDILVRAGLLDSGWRVATVWECALKGRTRLPISEVVDSMAAWLSSDERELIIEGQTIG